MIPVTCVTDMYFLPTKSTKNAGAFRFAPNCRYGYLPLENVLRLCALHKVSPSYFSWGKYPPLLCPRASFYFFGDTWGMGNAAAARLSIPQWADSVRNLPSYFFSALCPPFSPLVFLGVKRGYLLFVLAAMCNL